MENLFPIAIAVAATVGLAVYSWSKLNYTLRDAQPGTVEVALPQRVNAASLMKGDQTSKENLMRSLKKHGFAILELDNQLASAAKALENVGWDYFALPDETKDSNSGADRTNLGYIRIKGTREFIKLRPSDDERLWPSPSHLPEFKSIYREFFDRMFSLVWTAFCTIAASVDKSGKPLLNAAQLSAITEFVQEKSSVSLIHYYPQTHEYSCVCEEHKDSGLLTAVFKTGIPSLQMWDKHASTYIRIEEMISDSELVLFIGEKVPLFAQQGPSLTSDERLEGSPHRVIVPQPAANRLSMAFLLDVAK